MSFLVYPTIKQAPYQGLIGFGGGATSLITVTAGGVDAQTMTMTGSANCDGPYNAGNGWGSNSCNSSNDADVWSCGNSNTQWGRASFSPGIIIADWYWFLRNPNGKTSISMNFNSGTSFNVSTGNSPTQGSEVNDNLIGDTLVTQATWYQAGGSGNTHIYVNCLRINGTWVDWGSNTVGPWPQ